MGTTASLSAADLSSLTRCWLVIPANAIRRRPRVSCPATPPGTKFFLRFAFDAFTFRADGRQAGSDSIIRLRIERRMPRSPKGEVVRWQLEKNGCLRSCVAY